MEAVEKMLAEELEVLRVDIISRMRAKDLIVSGKTADSLSHDVANNVGVLRGVKYFPTVQWGRGPARGGNDSNGEFERNLINWIKLRGIQFETEEEIIRFAKYLKWRINKFGTELYKSGGRTDVYTPAFDAFADRISKKIIPIYKQFIITNIT